MTFSSNSLQFMITFILPVPKSLYSKRGFLNVIDWSLVMGRRWLLDFFFISSFFFSMAGSAFACFVFSFFLLCIFFVFFSFLKLYFLSSLTCSSSLWWSLSGDSSLSSSYDSASLQSTLFLPWINSSKFILTIWQSSSASWMLFGARKTASI